MLDTRAAGDKRRRWQVPALAVATFLYVWLRLDPSLLFEATRRYPAFAPDWHFALKTLMRPGGANAYVSAWLAQWFGVSWLGAIILTLAAGALCAAMARLLRLVSGRPAGWVALLPGTLTLILYSQFEFHLSDVTGLVLATVAAAAYAACRTRPLPVRIGWFAVLSVVLYGLIGGPYLAFVGLCAILEAALGSGRLPGLLYVLSGEALPQLLGVNVLGLRLREAFAGETPLDSDISIFGRLTLAALWAALLIITAVVARRAARPATAPSAPSRGRTVAVAALLVLPVVLSYFPLPALMLRTSAALRDGRYEDVLRLARGKHHNPPPLRLVHAINQSLYHVGRWPDDLCQYSQGAEGLMMGMLCGPGLRPTQIRSLRYDPPTAFECFEACLDFGLLSQAEREACESLEGNGPHARTLRALAEVNIVKGRPEAARHYLQALARIPWGARWAREKLAALQADPTQADDPEVRRRRAAWVKQDVHAGDMMFAEQMRGLLRHDETNRQAFEALMAFYLLNRDLKHFAELIERLPKVGYATIPRPWQEALVLWEATAHQVVGLPGYLIEPAVYADFARFGDLVRPYQEAGEMAQAQAVAAPDFGNSYFYYYSFAVSGVGAR